MSPFNFDDGPFTVTHKDAPPPRYATHTDGRRTRAQMITYAAEISFVSTVSSPFVLGAFIQQECVRFMRWDCAGTIVSESHDWMKTEIFLKFFWCIAKCTSEEQGHDPTVRLI